MERDSPEDQFPPIFKESFNPAVEQIPSWYVIPARFEIAASFHYHKSIFS